MEFNTPSPAVRYGRVFILTLANLSWNLFPLLIGCRQLLNIPYFISVRNVKKWKLNILMNLPSIFSQFEKKAFCPKVNNWSNLASCFWKITKNTASGNKKYITKIYSYSFDKIFSFFKQWRGCLTKSNLVWKERHQRCCSATFLLLLNRMLAGNWCQPPVRHKLCPRVYSEG